MFRQEVIRCAAKSPSLTVGMVNRQIPIAVSPRKAYVSDDGIVTKMSLAKPYLFAHAAHVLSHIIQHLDRIIFSYSRSLQQSSNY